VTALFFFCMTKDQLRKSYQNKRNSLSAVQRQKLEDLMLIQFQLLNIEIPENIMTYCPFEKMREFDPMLITDYCYFKNPRQQLFYPVMGKNHTMQCVLVDDDTLFEENKYGISEPVGAEIRVADELDLIIVPLLAYDVRGHRIGYGKGYYDRFLRDCRDDVLKIGFSFFEPEQVIPDVHRYDVKLDYCITPHRIYSF
jgi:5-formyltetrahydrofolate cyclo-ligase